MRLGLLVALLAALPSTAAFSADLGLTVRDGKLYRDGHVYRAVGVNYCDLFQELLDNPKSDRTLSGLRFLGEKKIPFLRFWASGFWPSDWDLYFRDKPEWFRRLDLVVHTAEEAHVGLIPDLFWNTATFPMLVGEMQDQWGNPDSKTIAFMRNYTREVVTRYKNSPAIWGWEFSNETNLGCDLPNGMEFLGKSMPNLKWELASDPRNLLTHQMAAVAYAAFADEVRKYDRTRFIETGNSWPRSGAYHMGLKLDPIWGPDNRQEAFEAFKWYAPEAMDVVSCHLYGDLPANLKYADGEGLASAVATLKEFATRLHKPLFMGEFAGSADEKTKSSFEDWQKQLLEAFVASKVDLAAYWVFDYSPDRAGVGLIRRGGDYAWVLDQIVEYNAKIKAQLSTEAR
jgi:hypothetical protein